MTMTVERPVLFRNDRVFFTGMAIAAAVTVFAGFAPTYYLRSHDLPPLSPLVQLHGLVFTSWIFLFVAQTTLVAVGRTDIHRRLGIFGGILAVAIVGIGTMVAVGAMRRGVSAGGMDPRVFLSIPLGDILTFAILVSAGVSLRRRSEAHKRLMLLAIITLLTPAIARLVILMHGQPPAFFVLTDVFVAAAVAYDFWSRGRVHPALILGGALVIGKPLLAAAASTPAWLGLVDALR
jgi:hypothetical protein